ncbi:hypothetical protein PP182_10245 [Maribacter sp. PR1]|uniref:Uncharacterized protein n=1 Tax=Maribacter cobaltidurans TaxID=1178778 RepID=A0ABU7IU13_9FLAO|nr:MULTISPECIES: hypothetical protein [Maribacter]MDC6389061.1 hypothetical protein [Maribacter sp. PR1]MEE1976448.1 hypothetical protein [Maribacter cobaltidurans]
MNNLRPILNDITKLVSNIETNYPELYQFLDESPITISSSTHPDIDVDTLRNYLESLKELLRHHLQTHKNRKL